LSSPLCLPPRRNADTWAAGCGRDIKRKFVRVKTKSGYLSALLFGRPNGMIAAGGRDEKNIDSRHAGVGIERKRIGGG
jgi:hypothetical protein